MSFLPHKLPVGSSPVASESPPRDFLDWALIVLVRGATLAAAVLLFGALCRGCSS